MRTIALLAITLLVGTSLTQVLNGCTESKCVACAQSMVTDKTSNRYCTGCKDSKLTITTANVDQKCEGSSTGTENCLVEFYDSTYAKVVCEICDKGYSLKRDDTAKTVTCVATQNGCAHGGFRGTSETCIFCENDMKFTAHTLNSQVVVKCESGGTEISNCKLKGLKTAPSALTDTIEQNCWWCDDGYVLKTDGSGTCMEATDQENKLCRHKTAFTDLCATCDWKNGEFAIGTAGSDTARDGSKGAQICGSDVLTVFATLFAGLIAFRF